ncbi:AEC family transporter [Acetobacterium carbinolicum]|uniref:AEC family transporter n=1 Tax=Acetobacterium carbinolicum TaxID=52690 RepID=UPI0039C8E7DD
MNINVVINQMLELFIILTLGYISAKRKIVSPKFGAQLSNFILSITLPCMMLASVASMPKDTDHKAVVMMFVIAILFYIVMPFIAYFITRILLVKKEDRHLYMYMTIWSNVGFMGFPVIASIFGAGAIFYATIFNLIFNVSNFTLGIMLMSKEGRKALDVKKFLSPGIMASIASVIMFSLKLQLPVLLNDTAKTVGSTTSALAMIVIGIALAEIPIKSVFTEIRLYPYVIIKQILLPLFAWVVLKNVIVNPYLLGIVIVIIAMPVATSTVLFANQYENNVCLATKGVFITTLASVVTIPMISYLLM